MSCDTEDSAPGRFHQNRNRNAHTRAYARTHARTYGTIRVRDRELERKEACTCFVCTSNTRGGRDYPVSR